MLKRIFLCLMLMLPFSGIGILPGMAQKSATSVRKAPTQKVTVLYFHGKQRCITCRSIEQCAKEVVKMFNPGKVEMKVIDISDPKNEQLVNQYRVSWSSLYLQKGKQKINLTEMGFRYAKNQPEEFKKRLRAEILKLQ